MRKPDPMNVSSAPTPDIFDVRKIRRLVELMKEHDLSEIDIQQGEVRIQLRRAGTTASPVMGPPPVHHYSPVPVVAGPPAPETDASVAAEGKAAGVALIKSPMVGTFYTAPDPESPAYVKIGDHVGPETTVCIVEAMKVFNQIPAEVSGRVIAMLVENGAPVEFGQPLFKVDTRE
jgi:acetyl-CoA carboxylase biotin carboxyl carrier protein